MSVPCSGYFSANYGQCSVFHVWTAEGEEYDEDGVPVFDKFAIVLKFGDRGIANQVKQK